MSEASPKRVIIGWREWVSLPGLCDDPIKVKVDTGAATSALHAFDLSVVQRDGEHYAEFEIHPAQRSRKNAIRVSVPIVGFRRIRSSSGHSERRPVISAPIRIGARDFATELTLTTRDEMGFRMLLGRAALRRRYVVDASRSYVQGPYPDKKLRRSPPNRGSVGKSQKDRGTG